MSSRILTSVSSRFERREAYTCTSELFHYLRSSSSRPSNVVWRLIAAEISCFARKLHPYGKKSRTNSSGNSSNSSSSGGGGSDDFGSPSPYFAALSLLECGGGTSVLASCTLLCTLAALCEGKMAEALEHASHFILLRPGDEVGSSLLSHVLLCLQRVLSVESLSAVDSGGAYHLLLHPLACGECNAPAISPSADIRGIVRCGYCASKSRLHSNARVSGALSALLTASVPKGEASQAARCAGNEAIEAKDYGGAVERYSAALALLPSLHPAAANLSFALLKLGVGGSVVSFAKEGSGTASSGAGEPSMGGATAECIRVLRGLDAALAAELAVSEGGGGATGSGTGSGSGGTPSLKGLALSAARVALESSPPSFPRSAQRHASALLSLVPSALLPEGAEAGSSDAAASPSSVGGSEEGHLHQSTMAAALRKEGTRSLLLSVSSIVLQSLMERDRLADARALEGGLLDDDGSEVEAASGRREAAASILKVHRSLDAGGGGGGGGGASSGASPSEDSAAYAAYTASHPAPVGMDGEVAADIRDWCRDFIGPTPGESAFASFATAPRQESLLCLLSEFEDPRMRALLVELTAHASQLCSSLLEESAPSSSASTAPLRIQAKSLASALRGLVEDAVQAMVSSIKGAAPSAKAELALIRKVMSGAAAVADDSSPSAAHEGSTASETTGVEEEGGSESSDVSSNKRRRVHEAPSTTAPSSHSLAVAGSTGSVSEAAASGTGITTKVEGGPDAVPHHSLSDASALVIPLGALLRSSTTKSSSNSSSGGSSSSRISSSSSSSSGGSSLVPTSLLYQPIPSAQLLECMECIVCFGLLFEPVTLPICQHTLCRPCLVRTLDHKPECPACRGDLRAFLAQHRFPINQSLLRIALLAAPGEVQARADAVAAERAEEMQTLPVFVCDVVLPYQAYPLHVFEPRYRLMMRRALSNGSRRFGMSPHTGGGAHANVGARIYIKSQTLMPDGRSYVDCVADGARWLVLEKGVRDGYCTARVKWLVDKDEGAEFPPCWTADAAPAGEAPPSSLGGKCQHFPEASCAPCSNLTVVSGFMSAIEKLCCFEEGLVDTILAMHSQELLPVFPCESMPDDPFGKKRVDQRKVLLSALKMGVSILKHVLGDRDSGSSGSSAPLSVPTLATQPQKWLWWICGKLPEGHASRQRKLRWLRLESFHQRLADVANIIKDEMHGPSPAPFLLQLAGALNDGVGCELM